MALATMALCSPRSSQATRPGANHTHRGTDSAPRRPPRACYPRACGSGARHVVDAYIWSMACHLDRAVAFLVPLATRVRSSRLSPYFDKFDPSRPKPTSRRHDDGSQGDAHRHAAGRALIVLLRLRHAWRGEALSALRTTFFLNLKISFVPFYKEEVHQGDSLNALRVPSGLLHAGSVFLPTAGGYATAAASRWLGTG